MAQSAWNPRKTRRSEGVRCPKSRTTVGDFAITTAADDDDGADDIW